MPEFSGLTSTTFIPKEKELYKSGLKMVAGVDEAGRGSFAGPLQLDLRYLNQIFF